jgi:hypothetical protein
VWTRRKLGVRERPKTGEYAIPELAAGD